MPEKLKSRKFWMALAGAVLPHVAAYLSSSVSVDEALKASAAIIIAYLFGQGYVDGKAALHSADE